MHPDILTRYTFFSALKASGAEVYLVGGCVRDLLLGKSVKDFDLVVRQLPIDDLTHILKQHGQTNLVGKSFGVIKFRPRENPELELDIALPRTEVSTGEGHKDFDVHFDPNLPLEEDLERRDFTINAMAKNLVTGANLDPFSGETDLKNRILRMVFETAFSEDPLRLMRAVQFAARFEFTVEPITFAKMRHYAPLISTVAKERIAEEIRKLFTAKKPSIGFDLMRDTGLLEIIFPDVFRMIGVTQPQKNNEDVYTHTMKVLDAARDAEELEKPGDLEIMLSALFHDAGKPKTRREVADDEKRVTFYNHQLISTGIAWHWMKQYRISTIGVNPKHVCHLVKHHMFETKEFHNEKALRRFIRKVGPQNIFDLLDLRLADKKGGRFPKKVYGILQLRERIHEEINRKAPFSAKDLAINGHDIMGLGFAPGPIIGRIQKFLVTKVVDEPELNTLETLTKIIEENRQAFLAGTEAQDLEVDDEATETNP